MADRRVKSLLDEFDVAIVGANQYPLPGQTRAVATIGRIIDRHGLDHMRLVMCTLAETKGAGGIVDEVTGWCVSDLVLACPEWVNERTSDWLEAWDALPLGTYMFLCQELAGIVKQRHALAGLCYAFLRGYLDRERSLARPVRAQPARGIEL